MEVFLFRCPDDFVPDVLLIFLIITNYKKKSKDMIKTLPFEYVCVRCVRCVIVL